MTNSKTRKKKNGVVTFLIIVILIIAFHLLTMFIVYPTGEYFLRNNIFNKSQQLTIVVDNPVGYDELDSKPSEAGDWFCDVNSY